MKKILWVFLALMLLCGCREEKPENSETMPALTVSAAQQALDDAMAEAKTEDEEVPAYLAELESRTQWRVLEVEDGGDGTGRATVKVSAPDLYSVIKALEQQTFSDSRAMDDAVTEGLRNAPLREREVALDFQLDGPRWEAFLSDSFTDACYGGLLTYRDELYASLEGAWAE